MAWACEGKLCGITRWGCCCDAPEKHRKEHCSDALKAHQAWERAHAHVPGDFSLTGGDACGCKLILTGSDPAPTATTAVASLSFPAVALLPASIALCTEPVSVIPADHFVETRGPPLKRRFLFSASLRGPPQRLTRSVSASYMPAVVSARLFTQPA